MAVNKHMVAFDCGNSSYRVVLGTYDGERITMDVISQVPNEMIEIGGKFYWDFLSIFQNLKRGLQEVARRGIRIDSLGICTWGVDFGLYDADGYLLGAPLSYRNTIGERALARFSPEERRQMFLETGILCDKINSAYMLAGLKEIMPARMKVANKLLMVPDILNYMFTGRMMNEPSELSTTQFMDARTRRVSPSMCRRFGIPESLFCQIGVHGEAIGPLLPSIREELGIDYDIPVVCVPSHDTGAAVFAVPAAEDTFLFVSSGTWSLIGTELDEPVVTQAAMDGNLTNEVGAFGRITLLRNNAGMFINQRLKPEYEAETGSSIGWTEFSRLALEHQGDIPLFDVNDVRFFNPASMSGAIREYLLQSGQVPGEAGWPTLCAVTRRLWRAATPRSAPLWRGCPARRSRWCTLPAAGPGTPCKTRPWRTSWAGRSSPAATRAPPWAAWRPSFPGTSRESRSRRSGPCSAAASKPGSSSRSGI